MLIEKGTLSIFLKIIQKTNKMRTGILDQENKDEAVKGIAVSIQALALACP